MKLNKIELKKVQINFMLIASRFMKVDFHDYDSVLEKFLAHLENVEIISDYIMDCGQPTYDIRKEVETVMQSYGRLYFELGNNEQQEVANIYHILKFCYENEIKIPSTIARSYSSSNKYQEMTKTFNERVVYVLIRYIETYLTKIGYDMGMDEHVKYSITVNNGQVNLATDNATINAIQNNGIDIQQLKILLDAVRRETISKLSQDDAEAAEECLEVIETELTQPKPPRKSLLKTALTGLRAIKGTAEFGAAVSVLVQFIQTVL